MSARLKWFFLFAVFVVLLVINIYNLAALKIVLTPGNYVTLNVNQLRPGGYGSDIDIPSLELHMHSTITFFEADAPSVQSVEVRRLPYTLYTYR